MTREANRIIGINPGTRYLGIAVLYGSELMDWRIKVLKEKWSNEKIERILEILREQIELYDINAMAIKKLHPSRSSKNLRHLVSRIKTLAKRKRIKVKSYSINEIERNFLEDEKPNKKNLAEKIVAEYPIIAHELDAEKSHKNIYHLRMFVAVALAAAYSRKLPSY